MLLMNITHGDHKLLQIAWDPQQGCCSVSLTDKVVPLCGLALACVWPVESSRSAAKKHSGRGPNTQIQRSPAVATYVTTGVSLSYQKLAGGISATSIVNENWACHNEEAFEGLHDGHAVLLASQG